MTAAGCASTPHRGAAGCGVYPLTLQQPQPLTPGENVTVVSRGYRCHDGTVSGSESVYFSPPYNPPDRLGATQVARDGAFEITVRIPPNAPPIPLGVLEASGPTREICAGTSMSCGGYVINVAIRR